MNTITTKNELFDFFRKKLNKFDKKEVDDVIEYYDEMIIDKISEGKSEAEVIVSFGDPNKLASSIISEMMATKKHNHGINGFLMLLGVCSTPILIPVAICFVTLYFVLIVVWIALIVAFVSSTIACAGFIFLSLFSGFTTFGSYLLGIGLGLFGCGMFALLSYLVIKYGWKLIDLINVFFARMIKKSLKKGND